MHAVKYTLHLSGCGVLGLYWQFIVEFIAEVLFCMLYKLYIF